MARAFDQREREIILERLLDAGEELFGRYGLRKTRVEELTREAGISKGSFYKFYKTKEMLCFSVLERVQRRQRDEMVEVAREKTGTASDRLERVIRYGLRMLKETPFLRMMLDKEEFAQLVRGVPADRLESEYSDDALFFQKIVSDMGASLAVDPAVATGLIRTVFFLAIHGREIAPGSEQGLVEGFVKILTRGLFEGETP